MSVSVEVLGRGGLIAPARATGNGKERGGAQRIYNFFPL